jgi:hypothetical protein
MLCGSTVAARGEVGPLHCPYLPRLWLSACTVDLWRTWPARATKLQHQPTLSHSPTRTLHLWRRLRIHFIKLLHLLYRKISLSSCNPGATPPCLAAAAAPKLFQQSRVHFHPPVARASCGPSASQSLLHSNAPPRPCRLHPRSPRPAQARPRGYLRLRRQQPHPSSTAGSSSHPYPCPRPERSLSRSVARAPRIKLAYVGSHARARTHAVSGGTMAASLP